MYESISEDLKLENLDEIRERINQIDDQMVKLFEERMKAAEKVAEYKKERSLPIKDEAREKIVIEKGCAKIQNEELKPYYVDFQRNVMDISWAYQNKLMNGMKVGYSGVPGAYAYIAAKRLFPDAELVSFSNFEPAFAAAEKGEIDCVVLPLENSYAGEVGNVMDLMYSGNLYVNRVASFDIEQNLLALPGAQIGQIKTVVSHPQALAQCDAYIKEHGFTAMEYSNTARAAAFVREQNDPSIAAIGSEEAAQLFDLVVLERKIHSTRNNSSRFGVFSRVKSLPPENERNDNCNFILMFTVPNEAGSLAITLDIIGSHGFNMRNLKSRPMKGLMWQYYFYVEAEGNIAGEDGQNMLQEIGAVCGQLKLAGTFLNE